jgi:predicted RNase H-like HicB family nuclease
MTYHFEVHKEENGYWGECKELDSCVSEGENMEELKANLQEALEGVLSVDFQGEFAHSPISLLKNALTG